MLPPILTRVLLAMYTSEALKRQMNWPPGLKCKEQGFLDRGPVTLAISYFKIDLFCHPERSEGSKLIGNTRFFATLRMTFHCEARF
jgi:hypothetical protein